MSRAHLSSSRMAAFSRLFNAAEFQALAQHLGERYLPQHVVSIDEIRAVYPHYLPLVEASDETVGFILEYLPQLQPFTQGPFLLPNGTIVQGPWLGEYKIRRFQDLGVQQDSLQGKRVLDIGCNAGFDTFYLGSLGPAEVIGIEPSAFYYQALFFWALYDLPAVQFLKARWQDISAAVIGRFDVINCQGILYHERNPQQLIDAMFDLLDTDGQLILETHVTLEDDMNARFVERAFWGEENWWWIPSAPVVLAMLRASGFVDTQLVVRHPVPSQNPHDELHTVENIPVGGRAYIVARRPQIPVWRKPG
ncbi:MAG: DUF1698 domain-containing protein [Chloroflexi bacterium]|nr:DUF1698 domain-containing protein [Chloroflexota bacterium]